MGKRKIFKSGTAAAAFVGLAAWQPALAQSADSTNAASTSEANDEIVVTGSQFRGEATPLALSIDPASDAASVTVLSAEDIARQSSASNIDIFRSIPGIQVGDFGQIGIAQGVSLRGWPGANDSSNLAFYLDGVQRNEPSGTGANGYLDTNAFIPEVIQSLVVVKGPFDTRYGGNFAQAGSAVLTTADTLPTSFSIDGGSYGRVRALATFGIGSSDGVSFYTAIAGMRSDGYQRNSDNKQLQSFSKLGLPLAGGRLTLSLQTYNTRFGSPGYLDLAQIKSGTLSPRAAVDDTDGGWKHDVIGIAQYKVGDSRNGLELSAFVEDETRNRYATFTPYPQLFTRNDRKHYGGSFEPYGTLDILGMETLVRAGVTVRHDKILDTREPSIKRAVISTPNFLDLYGYNITRIGQTSLGAYVEAQIKPAEWLKITAGERYDYFDYDVQNQFYVAATNSFAQQAVKADTSHASFKGSIVVHPLEILTIYANYGQSVVSPDGMRDLVRSADLDPAILTSKELGIAYNSEDGRFHLQGNYYWTTFSNEVTAVGQNAVNQGRTKRRGFDIDASAVAWRSDTAKVRLYGNYSWIHGRLESGGLIPNVADWVASYGLHADLETGQDMIGVDLGQQWTGSQSFGILGTEPYIAKPSSRISGKLSYSMPDTHNLKIWADGILYPGSRYNEFGFVLADAVYVTSLPRFRFQIGASIAM